MYAEAQHTPATSGRNRRTVSTLVLLAVGGLSLGVLLAQPPRAAVAAPMEDRRTIGGRTGLPTVREGQEEIWMERARVQIVIRGDQAVVTQTFWLHYPGPPLETKNLRARRRAGRLLPLAQAKVRSTVHRFGSRTKPFWSAGFSTIGRVTPMPVAACSTRGLPRPLGAFSAGNRSRMLAY